jgi:hypothetical protein
VKATIALSMVIESSTVFTVSESGQASVGRSDPTTSSCDDIDDHNRTIQSHHLRRCRSSSASNTSLGYGTRIVPSVNVRHVHHDKRAHSHDRQYYATSENCAHPIDRWKYEQQCRSNESDDDDNASESSMLWRARAKLNEFVTRTRRTQQQSPFYTAVRPMGTPTEDLYTCDDNESVTAETRL